MATAQTSYGYAAALTKVIKKLKGLNIRPAGIIFLKGLQLRVLLERGYYSRAWIILKDYQL